MHALMLVLLFASAAGASEPGIPHFHVEALPNGLTLVVAEDRYQPVVTLRAVVLAGGKHDPYDRRGLAHFTAMACGAGVPGLEGEALSREMQRLGINFSRWTDYRTSHFHMEGIKENRQEALALLASILTEPTLPDEDIARYRRGHIVGRRAALNDPSALAFSHHEHMMYGRPSRPTERSVRRISRDDIKKFRDAYYVPDRTTIIAVGDFETGDIIAALRGLLETWPRGGAPVEPAQPAPVRTRKIRLVHKPGLTQATMVWGMPCMNSVDPDRFALGLANEVLGGGGSASRLMEAVRSEGGRTYGINSGFQSNLDAGEFYVSTFTRNDGLAATMDTVQAVTEAFVEHGMTEEEFRRAKSHIRGSFALRYETPSQVVRALAASIELGRTLEDARLEPSYNEAVTQEDADRAAGKWIHPDEMFWVVVGDKHRIGDALKARFGKVETVYHKEPLDAGNFLTRTRVGVGAVWNGAARGPRLSFLHRRTYLSGTYGFERRDENWDYDEAGQVTLDIHRHSSEYSSASPFLGATGTLAKDVKGVSPHIGLRIFPYALSNHYSLSAGVGWSFWDVPENIEEPRGFYWSAGFEYFF
jgi:zinc protease